MSEENENFLACYVTLVTLPMAKSALMALHSNTFNTETTY